MDEKKRCWVDGAVQCPYGFPEGQYILRPEGFCTTDACPIYRNEVLEPGLTQRLEERAVVDYFDAHKVTMSSQLQALAEDLPEIEVTQKLALEQAAGIIVTCKRDSDIMLDDDLP